MITFANIPIGRTDKGGWRPLEEDVLGQLVQHECKNYKPAGTSTTTASSGADESKRTTTPSTTTNNNTKPEITESESTAEPAASAALQVTTLNSDHLIATLAEMISILNTRIDKLTTTVEELKAEVVRSKKK